MRRLDKLRVVGGRILNWIGRCWVPIVVTVAAVIWLSGLIIIISSMFSVAKQLQDIRTAEASVEENADEAKSNQKILLENSQMNRKQWELLQQHNPELAVPQVVEPSPSPQSEEQHI